MKKAIRVVDAKSAHGMDKSWNFNLITGPKWFIVCGDCEQEFVAQLPLRDNPTVVCKHCGAHNRLSVVFKGV